MQDRKQATGKVDLSTDVKGKKRKDPVWELRYRLPNGKQSDKILGKAWTKQSRPAAGFLTRREAEALAQTFLANNTNASTTDTRQSFGRALERFYTYCAQEKGLARGTIAGYKIMGDVLCARSWRKDLTWKDRPLDSFTEGDLLALRQEMLDAGLDPITINHYRRVLRGAFEKSGPIMAWNWVAVKNRDKSKGSIRFYTPSQVAQLLGHAVSDVDRATYILGAQQGLRVSEIRGLKILHLDFTANMIRIEDAYTDRGGHGATKSGLVRSLPMTRQCVAALQPLVAGRPLYDALGEPTLVFEEAPGSGLPLDYQNLYARFQRAVSAAELPRIVFHELRHTFGTTAIQHPDVDITTLQHLMGHAHITTTQIYLHYKPRPQLADALSSSWDEPEDNVVPLRSVA